jgi:undecaprenyl-diphosphatase
MPDTLIIFCAKYLPYLLGAIFIAVALWPRRRLRMGVAALVSAAVATGIIKPIIVFFWHRPRPFVVMPDVHALISAKGEEYSSFPSGHALFFFALAMAIYRYDKKLGIGFFAGATVMGIARVAAGVHWTSDIIGGALIGMLTAQVLTRVIPTLRPHA